MVVVCSLGYYGDGLLAGSWVAMEMVFVFLAGELCARTIFGAVGSGGGCGAGKESSPREQPLENAGSD